MDTPVPAQFISPYVISNGTVSQLQVPAGYVGGTGNAINNEGQVAGTLNPVSKSALAVAYIHQGTGPIAADISETPDCYQRVTPTSINNSADAVGATTSLTGVSGGFLYANGTFKALSPPAGYINVVPNVINENGLIACTACAAVNSRPSNGGVSILVGHPLLLLNGKFTDIGLPPAQFSGISAMNDSGEVLVSSDYLYSGGSRHSLYNPATVFGLPSSPISQSPFGGGTTVINNKGLVAGVISTQKGLAIEILSPG